MGIFSIFSKKKQEPELPMLPTGMPAAHFDSDLPDVKGSEMADFQMAKNPSFGELPEAREAAKAAFVSVQDYKAMVDSAEYIRTKLSQAEAMIAGMQELKKHGDKEIEMWKTKLDDVQKKLAFVEEVLSQGG
jgi:hypothetical protein